MGQDRVDQELQRRFDEARADLTEARATCRVALSAAYQKPMDAEHRIEDHYRRHGRDSLLKELRENPEQFGVRSGHPLTRDGWRENAPAREQHAKEALLGLAATCEVVVICKQRVAALESSLKSHSPSLAEDRQKHRGGPER